MAKKLLDHLSDALRTRHYSYRTEQAYLHWVRRFILFHQRRHPNEMGDEEIRAFLIHLAENEQVAASTHTARAIGAGGIKHLAHFFFSIAMSCIRN